MERDMNNVFIVAAVMAVCVAFALVMLGFFSEPQPNSTPEQMEKFCNENPPHSGPNSTRPCG